MKSIAFVSFEQHFYERFQFYSLAAYLKSKGFRVSYISENRFDKAIRRLKATKPDLIGYSVFPGNSHIYIEFDKLQKNVTDIRSVVGGSGAICVPEIFYNTTIDAICIGEGEDALVEYLRTNGASANNMLIKKKDVQQYNPLITLDQRPFPDREIVYNEEPYLKNMKYRMFLSGKGCPYQCTYCLNHLFNKRFKGCGKLIRQKSVDYFIEEIDQININYKPNLMIMQDEIFINDKQWLHDFGKKYKRIVNKPFGCYVRANLIDEDIVRMLKESGCITCVWSIESGNEILRNKVLKRNMSTKQIIDTADLLHKYGIRQRVTSIIGIPQETYGNIQETIELNIRCKPDFALACTLVPYPNLAITEYAIKTGYLKSHYNKLPNNYTNMTILNFPQEDKILYLKTVYLFPLFVDFPILYRKFRKILYKIPLKLLKYIFAFIEMYKPAVLYPFKPTFRDIVAIMNRYLKYFTKDFEKID